MAFKKQLLIIPLLVLLVASMGYGFSRDRTDYYNNGTYYVTDGVEDDITLNGGTPTNNDDVDTGGWRRIGGSGRLANYTTDQAYLGTYSIKVSQNNVDYVQIEDIDFNGTVGGSIYMTESGGNYGMGTRVDSGAKYSIVATATSFGGNWYYDTDTESQAVCDLNTITRSFNTWYNITYKWNDNNGVYANNYITSYIDDVACHSYNIAGKPTKVTFFEGADPNDILYFDDFYMSIGQERPEETAICQEVTINSTEPMDYYYNGTYYFTDGIDDSDTALDGTAASNGDGADTKGWSNNGFSDCSYSNAQAYKGSVSLYCDNPQELWLLDWNNGTFTGSIGYAIYTGTGNTWLAKSQDTDTTLASIGIREATSGTKYSCNEGGWAICDGAIDINFNTWDYFIWNYTGSNTIEVSVNGQLLHTFNSPSYDGIDLFSFATSYSDSDFYVDDFWVSNEERPTTTSQAGGTTTEQVFYDDFLDTPANLGWTKTDYYQDCAVFGNHDDLTWDSSTLWQGDGTDKQRANYINMGEVIQSSESWSVDLTVDDYTQSMNFGLFTNDSCSTQHRAVVVHLESTSATAELRISDDTGLTVFSNTSWTLNPDSSVITLEYNADTTNFTVLDDGVEIFQVDYDLSSNSYFDNGFSEVKLGIYDYPGRVNSMDSIEVNKIVAASCSVNPQANFTGTTFTNFTKSNNLSYSAGVTCTDSGQPLLFVNKNGTYTDSDLVKNGTGDWSFNDTILDTDGTYYFQGYCDALGVFNSTYATEQRLFILDTTEPQITLASNNGFNDFNVTANPYSNNLPINISISDAEDLYGFQFQIQHNNGTYLVNYTNESLSGLNAFTYTNDINVTSYDSRNDYRVIVRASDSHTKNEICPFDDNNCYKPKKKSSELEFDTPEGLNIRIVTKDTATADYEKLKDRYSFQFDYADGKSNKKRVIDIYADKVLNYVGDTSGYPGHFIAGDNWIDFAGDGITSDDITIKKITDYHYELSFKKLKVKQKFDSIGGLNIGLKEFNYIKDVLVIDSVDITPETPITSTDLETYCQATSEVGYNVSYHYNVKQNTALIYTGNTSYSNSTVLVNLQNVSNTLTSVGDNWSIECRARTTLDDYYTDFSIDTVTIQDFTLDNCTISNNTVFNISSFNENTIDPLAIDIVGTFTYTVGDLTNNFSVEYNNITNVELCLYPINNYTIDAYFQYETADDSGVQERYYIRNAQVRNETNDVYLYNFDDTTGLSQLAVITYDNTYSTLEGLIGKLQRYYPGEDVWRTVQVDETDEDGQLLFYVYQNVEDYRIIWEEDGSFYDETAKLKFICALSNSCDASFVVTAPDITDRFTGYTSDITYNNNTGIVTLTWADTNSFVSSVRFLVEKQTFTGSTTICDTTLASSSGTINCDISSYDGVIIATAYRAASPSLAYLTEVIDKVAFTLGQLLEDKGLQTTGTFFMFLIMTALIGFGAATGSPFVVLIFIVLGGIVNYFLGLGNLISYGLLFTLGAVALLIAYIVRR